jgi:hypothetical protein
MCRDLSCSLLLERNIILIKGHQFGRRELEEGRKEVLSK